MFSQRLGITEPQLFQKESMDQKLKNDLWNTIEKHFLNKIYYEDIYSVNRSQYDDCRLSSCENYKLILALNEDFYFLPIGNIENASLREVKKSIKTIYDSYKWYEVYDFIEYIFTTFRESSRDSRNFVTEINLKLQRNNSAYRFVEAFITEITNEFEINSINSASDIVYSVVNEHIKKAVKFLSNRENPDFENSIKESVMAVEAMCKIIVGSKTTLGKALGQLESKGIKIHPSLKESFNKLYGYTSDASGVRHAGDIGGKNSTFAEAKFMLVCCSAFINYLIENYNA